MSGRWSSELYTNAGGERHFFVCLYVTLLQRYLFGSNKVIKNENPRGERVYNCFNISLWALR